MNLGPSALGRTGGPAANSGLVARIFRLWEAWWSVFGVAWLGRTSGRVLAGFCPVHCGRWNGRWKPRYKAGFSRALGWKSVSQRVGQPHPPCKGIVRKKHEQVKTCAIPAHPTQENCVFRSCLTGTNAWSWCLELSAAQKEALQMPHIIIIIINNIIRFSLS